MPLGGASLQLNLKMLPSLIATIITITTIIASIAIIVINPSTRLIKGTIFKEKKSGKLVVKD